MVHTMKQKICNSIEKYRKIITGKTKPEEDIRQNLATDILISLWQNFEISAQHYNILLSNEFFNLRNILNRDDFFRFANNKLKLIGLECRFNFSENNESYEENIVYPCIKIEHFNNVDFLNNLPVVFDILKNNHLIIDLNVFSDKPYADLSINEYNEIEALIVVNYDKATRIKFKTITEALASVYAIIKKEFCENIH